MRPDVLPIARSRNVTADSDLAIPLAPRKDAGAPTFAEFFAGIGLVRQAIEPLGWQCVFANDIAHGKAEMYGARFGTRDFLLADIRHVDAKALPAKIDLVTASFPCIDLSLAGNRAGLAGQHSGTIWPFLDLLEARHHLGRRPAAVLLENVTGFLSSHGGRDLAAVCRTLAALGYAVDLAMVDARWFTPQSRPRLFVLATEADEANHRSSIFGASGAPGVVSRIRPRAVRDFQNVHPDIPFVDMPLPEPPHRASQRLSALLEDLLPDDERWWPADKTATLLRNMAVSHRRRVDGLLAGERDGVATLYRRRRNGRTVGEVRSDCIAGCLRTPQGGSSVQFLVDCRTGKPRVRPLTGREYANLQGAERFPIRVGDRQARMGFGDAVCVPAVRWLVRYAFAHMVAVPRAAANGSQVPARESLPESAVSA